MWGHPAYCLDFEDRGAMNIPQQNQQQQQQQQQHQQHQQQHQQQQQLPPNMSGGMLGMPSMDFGAGVGGCNGFMPGMNGLNPNDAFKMQQMLATMQQMSGNAGLNGNPNGNLDGGNNHGNGNRRNNNHNNNNSGNENKIGNLGMGMQQLPLGQLAQQFNQMPLDGNLNGNFGGNNSNKGNQLGGNSGGRGGGGRVGGGGGKGQGRGNRRQNQQQQLDSQAANNKLLQDLRNCKPGNNNANNNTTNNNNNSGNHPSGSFPQAKYINMVICKAADRGDMQSLLNLVAAQYADMSCVNLSTAMHKLARFAKEDDRWALAPGDQRFAALHGQIRVELERQVGVGLANDGGIGALEAMDDSMPRCWSTIAWAYGTLQVKNLDTTQTFRLIGRLALAHLTSFKPLELTNLLWGFAKVKCSAPQLFQAATKHICMNLKPFSSSNLSTLIWALVTAQQHDAETVQKIVEEFALRLPTSEVKPVELTNLMWGLATAKLHPKANVLYEVGGRALELLPEFKLQELSITCWSFARLHARYDRLFSGVATHLATSQQLLLQIHPQGMANLLWAFEKQLAMGSGATDPILTALRVLIPRCLALLKQLKPQEFACVFRALACMGVKWNQSAEADLLFSSAAGVGLVLIRRLSAPQCVDLLSAFSNFLTTTSPASPVMDVFPSFLEALAQRCLENVSELGLSGAMHVVEVAARAAHLFGDKQRQLVSVLARLVLQVRPERFSTKGQKMLATLCNLSPEGSSQEVDLDSLRAALTSLAAETEGVPGNLPVDWANNLVPMTPGPLQAGPRGFGGHSGGDVGQWNTLGGPKQEDPFEDGVWSAGDASEDNYCNDLESEAAAPAAQGCGGGAGKVVPPGHWQGGNSGSSISQSTLGATSMSAALGSTSMGINDGSAQSKAALGRNQTMPGSMLPGQAPMQQILQPGFQPQMQQMSPDQQAFLVNQAFSQPGQAQQFMVQAMQPQQQQQQQRSQQQQSQDQIYPSGDLNVPLNPQAVVEAAFGLRQLNPNLGQQQTQPANAGSKMAMNPGTLGSLPAVHMSSTAIQIGSGTMPMAPMMGFTQGSAPAAVIGSSVNALAAATIGSGTSVGVAGVTAPVFSLDPSSTMAAPSQGGFVAAAGIAADDLFAETTGNEVGTMPAGDDGSYKVKNTFIDGGHDIGDMFDPNELVRIKANRYSSVPIPSHQVEGREDEQADSSEQVSSTAATVATSRATVSAQPAVEEAAPLESRERLVVKNTFIEAADDNEEKTSTSEYAKRFQSEPSRQTTAFDFGSCGGVAVAESPTSSTAATAGDASDASIATPSSSGTTSKTLPKASPKKGAGVDVMSSLLNILHSSGGAGGLGAVPKKKAAATLSIPRVLEEEPGATEEAPTSEAVIAATPEKKSPSKESSPGTSQETSSGAFVVKNTFIESAKAGESEEGEEPSANARNFRSEPAPRAVVDEEEEEDDEASPGASKAHEVTENKSEAVEAGKAVSQSPDAGNHL